eukprot:5794643-Pleurochrysis_carterae.AAC.1
MSALTLGIGPRLKPQLSKSCTPGLVSRTLLSTTCTGCCYRAGVGTEGWDSTEMAGVAVCAAESRIHIAWA